MNITVAENAGFCFGVKRAVTTVTELAEGKHKGRICTVGSLIHNPQVLSELEKKGVSSVSEDELEELYKTATPADPVIAVIRTHGVTKHINEKLNEYAEKNPNFTVCDLTCPFVKKIHNIVLENKDRKLIVFGDAVHPEVRGIVSYSDGQAIVVDSPEKAENIEGISNIPVILVAQTTQNTAKWEKTQKIIKKVCTNAIIFDTICNVTDKRQTETASLASQVDVMLIIGSKSSSNTGKLFDTSKKYLDRTYFIEEPCELDKIKFTPFEKVGITAGASTPCGIIQEVIKHMSEIENKISEDGSESFADLLENSLKTLNTGDTVTGVITSVSSGELHVDLGTKVTGIIPYDEVTSDTGVNLSEMFKPGDEVEAYVIKVSDRDGVATLSKRRIDSKVQWKNIIDAYNNETIIEGKIVSVIKGGVLMDYASNRVFIPASQTGVPKSGDLNSIVGTVQRARIIEINEGRKRAVASIRRVKNEERKEKEAEFWANIEVGKQYNGEVKSLTSYGAFVDLGGVDGMVHSSELSWTRIKNPAEVVSIGDKITVFVKDFNAETKRISLGYKTDDTNPWNIFTSQYHVGDVAEVKIVSLMPFGAFAQIVPGCDGLIHISQITDHKIAQPSEILSVGDVVKAEIVSIDEERHQIGLSMRSLIEEKSEPVEEVAENTAD